MAPIEKRKRGRPSGASSRPKDASQSTNAEAQDDDAPRPRKRGRPSPKEKQGRGQSHATVKEGQPSQQRGRPVAAAGRTGTANGATTTTTPTADEREQKRRKRRSLANADASVEASDGAEQDQRASTKKKRGRPSLEKDTEPTERRRASTADKAAEEEPPPSPPKPYRHIAPRTRRIRRSHIKSKWSPLDAACLAQATSILQLAHRPILQRLAGTSQRQLHTSSALQLIVKRITRRLEGGLPFPPSVQREIELSFEGVLNGKTALERQLDPALDAVELLKRERKRVEDELERDYETLRNLEAGARKEARQKRDLLKKAHVLAPEKLRVKSEERDVVFKTDPNQTAGPVFTSIDDTDLKASALQLGGHLDSMKTNLRQVDGIVDGISHSRAALQEALLRNLDLERYEQVILG